MIGNKVKICFLASFICILAPKSCKTQVLYFTSVWSAHHPNTGWSVLLLTVLSNLHFTRLYSDCCKVSYYYLEQSSTKYKLLILVSCRKLEAGPRFADTCSTWVRKKVKLLNWPGQSKHSVQMISQKWNYKTDLDKATILYKWFLCAWHWHAWWNYLWTRELQDKNWKTQFQISSQIYRLNN